MSIDIAFEWLDAPGVRTPALAATWARMQITVDGAAVTRFWSERHRSVLDAVYTSTFPLARWAVENWWFITSEGLAAEPGPVRGVALAPEQLRGWLRRHDPFLAREGMSYPDICVFRAESMLGLTWTSTSRELPLPGQFLESGEAVVEPSQMREALARFIEATLARVDGVEDEEVQDLRSLWVAVQRSERDEPELCARLAALGLNPYAPDLDGRVVEAVDAVDLPSVEAADLMRATNVEELGADVAIVKALHAALPPAAGPPPAGSRLAAPVSVLPYRTGYLRARAVREHLGWAHDRRVEDLPGVARALLGGPMDTAWVSRRGASAVDAVVEVGGNAMAAIDRGPRGQRFVSARALHHGVFVGGPGGSARLLTRGRDWTQAASRAFAAELLAPAEALAARLDEVSWEEDGQALADEFEVSQLVIAHQLQNHGLSAP